MPDERAALHPQHWRPTALGHPDPDLGTEPVRPLDNERRTEPTLSDAGKVVAILQILDQWLPSADDKLRDIKRVLAPARPPSSVQLDPKGWPYIRDRELAEAHAKLSHEVGR